MKPSIPSGTRDFSPKEMVKRNFILSTIRAVFVAYGYQQIETPAMENLSTLEAKYGEEGDKLLFRILNSGPVIEEIRNNQSTVKLSDIAEKGLRYDLTVPFARYVVQHRNDISFPFKRYQIQPVWRGDRPGKGRYREFYQCDADVIGSDSLMNDLELVQIIDDAFTNLHLPVTIKLNNRKILASMAAALNAGDKLTEMTVAIDKLEKIGVDGVNKELSERGFSGETIRKLGSVLSLNGTHSEKMNFMTELLPDKIGLEELGFIFDRLGSLRLRNASVEFDPTLARGLNYYTGTIYEVKSNKGTLASTICGGGRYDNLTGIFGLEGVSGVGVSFGIDRIFDVMNELSLFDSLGLKSALTQVLLSHFGESERDYCLQIASAFRNAGVNTEIYPDITKKISKQFDYANKKDIPFVIVIGEEEMKSGLLSFKNMTTGQQEKLKLEEIVSRLKS